MRAPLSTGLADSTVTGEQRLEPIVTADVHSSALRIAMELLTRDSEISVIS